MEHRSISIADQIFERLEREILIGEHSRGDILTEMKLSEKLGVSRTPIREALRRLAQENIIEMTPKGAVVIGISREDLKAIYEMRYRVEGMAANLAAQHITPESAQELRSIVDLQEFYTLKGDAENIKNMDSAFHEKMYELSKTPPLCSILKEMHKKILKYRRASVSNSSRAEHSLQKHRAICEAIANGNAELAEMLVTFHIDNARKHLMNVTA
jgi:DNA-binding GntR family transcriptional regulator